MADPQTNKQTVLAYLNTAFNDKRPAEAVEIVRRIALYPVTTLKRLTASKRSFSS